MDDSDDPENKKAGFRKPPLNSRFRKGQNGNARGRPRKSAFQAVENIIKQRVPITINGKERMVPLNEALLRVTAKRAIEDDDVYAIKEMWKMSEGIRQRQLAREPKEYPRIIIENFDPEECEEILLALGILGKDERNHEVIEDWVDEAAVRRNPKLSPGKYLRRFPMRLPHTRNM